MKAKLLSSALRAHAGKLLGIALLGVCTVLPLAAHAAPPTEEQVDRLLKLNGAHAALEAAVRSIGGPLRQQLTLKLLQTNKGAPLTPNQRQAVENALPPIENLLRTELSWDSVRPAYLNLYQKQFSAEEVEQLIALYEDPGYVALMKKMQVVNLQSSRLIQDRLPKVLPKLEPLLVDAVKGLAPMQQGPGQ
ncbi:DUF2059 domain-containing protein [Hydrogenophaga sp. 5NK40-0174]|uniref:DUF2059 domain-containing protein n=1 Tax=Hydrogenophaga sp. 5NK40-0174 TaxID=3127649 RepID=UPI00310AF9F1